MLDVSSVFAGVLGAVAGAVGKAGLDVDKRDYIVGYIFGEGMVWRYAFALVCVLVMLLLNSAMMAFTSRSMKAVGSVRATAVASNIGFAVSVSVSYPFLNP